MKTTENKVIVEVIKEKENMQNGIYMPNTTQPDIVKAKVKLTGPGRVDNNGNRVPMSCEPGDIILYQVHSARPLKFDGNDFQILPDQEILINLGKE